MQSPIAKAYVATIVTVAVYVLSSYGVVFPDGFNVSDTQFADALLYILGAVVSGGLGGYLVWATPNKEKE